MKRRYMPSVHDPERDWVWIGGDLEASFDGFRYVDIRDISSKKRCCFLSEDALKNALALFHPIIVEQ